MTYVFIHGLGQTPSSWDKIIVHLPSGIQIYRPSLVTNLKDKQITWLNLYQEFEEECHNMETPLNLCGISLGAVLALQYAINNPQKVQSLILIAPQYKMPRVLLSIQNVVFRIMPKSAFTELGFSKNDTITLMSSMKKIDFTPFLSKITCSTYIVCGQKDIANRKAAIKLANIIPNAKSFFIENAGHEINADAPEALADLIKEVWFNE